MEAEDRDPGAADVLDRRECVLELRLAPRAAEDHITVEGRRHVLERLDPEAEGLHALAERHEVLELPALLARKVERRVDDDAADAHLGGETKDPLVDTTYGTDRQPQAECLI